MTVYKVNHIMTVVGLEINGQYRDYILTNRIWIRDKNCANNVRVEKNHQFKPYPTLFEHFSVKHKTVHTL